MTRVPVNPESLRWARERAGLAQRDLAAKFKKLPEWEGGETQPTLKQVEAFARAVHVPVGYLFLAKPPEEPLPIPDFRTIADQHVTCPSPNLLDTIFICQERQSWYRDFARVAQQPELGYVGSATVETPPESVAARIRKTLGFDLAARRECPTWSEELRLFIRQAENAGVLVMVSGVVMSNNHRDELRVGEDALADRAAERTDDFFLRPVDTVISSSSPVKTASAKARRTFGVVA